jgi:hypothetical protein
MDDPLGVGNYENAGNSGWPAIAADSVNNIHVSWMDDTPGNAEVFYRKSTDGGAAWAAAKRLTWTSGWSDYPDIAADSAGNLHVVM